MPRDGTYRYLVYADRVYEHVNVKEDTEYSSVIASIIIFPSAQVPRSPPPAIRFVAILDSCRAVSAKGSRKGVSEILQFRKVHV